MTTTQTKKTFYKSLKEFPLYRIGSNGKIQSKQSKGPKIKNTKTQWKTLKPEKDERGRKRVKLMDFNGQYKKKFIHVLVLETFVGPRPSRMYACHNDGDATNNRLGNLRWDTGSNNQLDRKIHGTACVGDKNPNSKLIQKEVIEIRERIEKGETCAALSKEYKVSAPTISNIALGRTWKHAGGPIAI